MNLVKNFGYQDLTVTFSKTNGNYESLKVEDFIVYLTSGNCRSFRVIFEIIFRTTLQLISE